MGILGHNWKDEETPEQRFEDFTGQKPSEDIVKDIDRLLESPYASRTDRRVLGELKADIEKTK